MKLSSLDNGIFSAFSGDGITPSAVVVGAVSFLYVVWKLIMRPYLENKKPDFGVIFDDKNNNGSAKLQQQQQDLPMPPHSHWLFGHGKVAFQNKGDWISGITKHYSHYGNKYGQSCFWAFHRGAIAVTDWKDARTILKNEHMHYTFGGAGDFVKRYLESIVGSRSILLLNGKDWKNYRTPVAKAVMAKHPLIHARKDIVTVITSLVTAIKDKIHEQQQKEISTSNSSNKKDAGEIDININDIMQMITLDVFGKAALNCDFKCCENLVMSPIAKSLEFLIKDATRRIERPLSPLNRYFWIPTTINQRNGKERKFVRSYIRNIIKEESLNQQRQKQTNRANTASPASTSNDSEKQNNNKENLISLLRKALKGIIKQEKDKKSKKSCMTSATEEHIEELLSDALITLVFAGFDTTSITLTYALYLVSKHPEIEQTCLAEIYSVCKIDNKTSTDVNIHDPTIKFPYCSSVIWETLRLYAPAIGVNRHLQKPVKLSGGFIAPKGSVVFVPIFVMNRLERNFSNPLELRPDRWVKQEKDNTWVYRNEENDDDEDDDGKNDGNNTKNTDTKIPIGNKDAIFTFSAGGRNCPGEKFAIQEAILSFVYLIKELQFTPLPSYELKPVRQLALQRPNNMVMKVRIRSP